MFGRSKLLDEHARCVELEPRDDLLTRRQGRGRRERHARHAGEPLLQHVQTEILGAKIVAPLRYAVRFVDRDDREGHFAQQRLRFLLQQPLGSEIEQLEAAVPQIAQ